MRAAIAVADVVGEAQAQFVVAIVVLHGDFDFGAFGRLTHQVDHRMHRFFARIQIAHKTGEAVGVVEDLAFAFFAFVAQGDAHAVIQEGQLAHARRHRGIDVDQIRAKDFGVRMPGDLGAAVGGIGNGLKAADSSAFGKAHAIMLAVTMDFGDQQRRHGIHATHTDAMQAA